MSAVRRNSGLALLALLLGAVCFIDSCGGGNSLSQEQGQAGNPAALGQGAEKSTALIPAVRECDIGSLPRRQQELLSDAGWNQPYIAPRAGTPVAAPSLSALREETAKALAAGAKLNPRYARDAGKGASWYGDSAGPFGQTISRAEYEALALDAVPPFGCNSDGTNEAPSGNALEDLVNETALDNPMPVFRLSYVREGLCTPNYFNTLAGANKNQSAAVYQAYCSVGDGGFDPRDPPHDADVAEISYRSSLVPDGSPAGVCNATAYVVRNYIWRTFNSELYAIPDYPVDAYDVLIAPSGPVSMPEESLSYTTGIYQPFYFGSMSACYGGAWIIGLTASDSHCDIFAEYFDPDSPNYAQPEFWYKPIYGVLLQRWLDMAPVAGEPWLSELGWPVYGPLAYDNGTLQLNSKGAYYAWGMWFERGFIWWVDYDQAVYPNVPDEAQAYRFTGYNVYCYEERYELLKIAPVQFYGNAGPLGVNVTVDAYRNEVGDDWEPVKQDMLGTEYFVDLPAGDGLAIVQVKLHASGYGGTPNAECKYKTYVWAFRDGTIQPAGADYADAQKSAVHAFGDLCVNKESVYVVRVQVQDEVGFAYGDTLPIVLGHGGAGCSDLLVIRDDAPGYDIYNTNFNALLADLDALGAAYAVVNFRSTVAEDLIADGYSTAIWYRGGPGNASEPEFTTPWTADEIANFTALLKHPMLLISQAHGSVGATYANSYWGWDNQPGSQLCRRINEVLLPHEADRQMGLESDEINGCFYRQYAMFGSEMGAGQATTAGPQYVGLGPYSCNGAEQYLGAGSSGKVPIMLKWADGGTDVLQFCGRGWSPFLGDTWTNSGWRGGLSANPGGNGNLGDVAFLSYGCTSTGGSTWNSPGPGRFWCWGMPYAKLQVTHSAPEGMTRARVLQNVLSWLYDGLTFGNGNPWGHSHYDGEAEIVQVMPGYWTTSPPNFVRGSVVQPRVNYPDTTGTDVYRTNYTNGPGERYISTATPGNNGMDDGDLDFQFPWYACITTTNGEVETSVETASGGPPLPTDDVLAVRGLLVSDADQNWVRYTLPTGELPNCLLNAGPPTPAVVGYFVSAAGDTGDEQYASYGTANPSLSWDNSYTLEVEVIAHWPDHLHYGQQPARLQWSMYPGHNLRLPGSSVLLKDTPQGWSNFRGLFDIDPGVDPPGRATSTWNAAAFSYSSYIGEGRVVAFNYRNIPHWNPDLNYDGDTNQDADRAADKFPIRCRLFTDFDSYFDTDLVTPGVQPRLWPDNQPPASTYLEGGCYVVDTGAPVFPFRILDNPDKPDPQETITGAGGDYEIYFYFYLDSGVPTYNTWVEFDPQQNDTWGNPGSYVYPLDTNIPVRGPITNVLLLHAPEVVPPPGSYWLTLRGVDSDIPTGRDYYTYKNEPLVLLP